MKDKFNPAQIGAIVIVSIGIFMVMLARPDVIAWMHAKGGFWVALAYVLAVVNFIFGILFPPMGPAS